MRMLRICGFTARLPTARIAAMFLNQPQSMELPKKKMEILC